MSSKYAYKRGGGLSGKSQRARGRRGMGRPAAFGPPRLGPDGQPLAPRNEDDDEEEVDEEERELQRKFARRELGSNAHRYDEPEPEDGEEPEPEPEVDLSAFLEKQRLEQEDKPLSAAPPKEDDEGVDHSLDQILGGPSRSTGQGSKGHVQTIEWTEEMAAMAQEKSQADATRDLSSRFRTKASGRGFKAPGRGRGGASTGLREAPPIEPVAEPTSQEFLDDLLG